MQTVPERTKSTLPEPQCAGWKFRRKLSSILSQKRGVNHQPSFDPTPVSKI
jgi:hypothetical protein